jgi:hypothetical protein
LFKIKSGSTLKWCYWAKDSSANRWVQVRYSNLVGIERTDDQGNTEKVLAIAKSDPGKPVELGVGARMNFDTGTPLAMDEVYSGGPGSYGTQVCETSEPSRQCVLEVMKFLVSISVPAHPQGT